MSTHALPMLFFNLGGEMLYVLDQRLRAQNVPLLKGKKVMADIVSMMFSHNFTNELFKSQSMYSRNVMRSMFDRLVHSSIMRVDTDSMEKLYDLMVMTLKYQIIRCQNPQDLLHITLNHLDAILEFVSSSSETKKLVAKTFEETVALYAGMPIGELIMIRQLLLNFFHDSKNRVSVFVNSKSQNSDGTFVISKSGPVFPGVDVPGKIYYFTDEYENETFITGSQFKKGKVTETSNDIGGVRSTNLGTNLYANDYSLEHLSPHDPTQPSNQGLAKAELGLLGHLMGASKSSGKDSFKLNLFATDEEVLKVSSPASDAPIPANVVAIKAESSGSEELKKLVEDFNVTSTKAEDSSADEGLLYFMDNM